MMPFEYILNDLLSANEGAMAALFLDDTGETVTLACADDSPYQMKVLGAYLGITLKQQQRILRSGSLGEVGLLHIERADVHVFVSPLADGYYLVLVVRAPAGVARARQSLERAAAQLTLEIQPA